MFRSLSRKGRLKEKFEVRFRFQATRVRMNVDSCMLHSLFFFYRFELFGGSPGWSFLVDFVSFAVDLFPTELT